MRRYRTLLFLLNVVVACAAATSWTHQERVKAFPGAEGYGQYTTGGRGGAVYIVTSLADHGPGTLRDALQQKGPRTITFAVSGYIDLERPLKITTGQVTIAGQSAPGAGITLRYYPVEIAADQVIIRYLRFRLGDVKHVQDDALTCLRQRDIIIDHCSISWATDECASFYDNENFTLQWSIISESLNASVHEKGEHGYGGIWGGKGASFHHNLLIHHNSRLPRFCGARYHHQPDAERVDFINNVIYNWMSNSSYGGEQGHHNMVGNYYRPGPATRPEHATTLINPYAPYGWFYVRDNILDGNARVTDNNMLGIRCDSVAMVWQQQPVTPVQQVIERAEAAYQRVLQYAGSSRNRDAVDQRLIQEVSTGKASAGKRANGIIDSQEDVGGWPSLPAASAPLDTDRDGMPDAWEMQRGLNKNSPHDATSFKLDAAYTNLEVYLNTLI